MILRAVKDSRWSAINNTVLNDERLSWRARGIAAYLLTKPDDWRIDHTHLWRAGKEGRDAVLAAMKELEICGYLVRRRYQKPDGKFATEVQLHEMPQPKSENQETDFQEVDSQEPNTAFQEPTTENQESVNQKSVFQDSLLILKPITERKLDEDDPRAGDAVEAAWMETFGAYMPETLLPLMARLLAECDEAAVIHGIKAAAEAKARKFAYIAKCARNYIPPAPPPASNGHGRYSVEIEPRPLLSTAPVASPAAAHTPAASADPWATTLDELRRAYAGSDWIAMLDGSHLELAEDGAFDAHGNPVPRYRVCVAAGVDVQRLTNRGLRQIRFTLGSILGAPFLIQIVAAEAEREVNPQ